MKRWLLFLLIVGPITALLAFGLTRDPNILPSVMIGKKAPPFTLRTLDGAEISLASLAGHPAVVNFWATWCGPCFHEHPSFKRARELFEGEGVRFIGVVYQDRERDVREFLKEYGTPFDVAWDPESKMAIDYGVGGVPETFFIDANGIISEKLSGVATLSYLREQISQLLQDAK